MEINSEGLSLLKAYESCRLTAYKLTGEKYYTIGWGHYGADVSEGQTITQAQADALLKSDLAKFEGYVNKYACTKFDLNSNQFSALVSYVYNRGLKGLKQLVDNSDTVSAMADNIVIYWGSATRYKTALINRRKREQALFNKAVTISYEEIAKEVIAGKWGNGAIRKERLTAAGYDYKTVQKYVNIALKS